MSLSNVIYEPSNGLSTRVSRRLVRYQHISKLNIKTERPVVSFTFDDCPKSVVENAFPLLEKQNWKSTLYIAMGLCDTTNHLGLHMSKNDVESAHRKGHEIGNHTFSHLDARAVNQEDFLADVLKNEAAFRDIGIPQSSTFAYPYGEITSETKKRLSGMFDLSRGIHAPRSTQQYDLNQAASQRLYSGHDFEACIHALKAFQKDPGWLIIFTHDVRENPSQYGCTPEEFNHIVNLVDIIGADVKTVAEALNSFKPKHVNQAA